MRRSPSNGLVSDTAYVALGSNLGDREAYLAAARAALSIVPGVTMIAASAVEETAPIGTAVQGPYLNQMVAVQTELAPAALLVQLQRIERGLGRVRSVRWGARTIDLDIVRYDGARVSTATLQLPHPGLNARTFWQRELAELATLIAA